MIDIPLYRFTIKGSTFAARPTAPSAVALAPDDQPQLVVDRRPQRRRKIGRRRWRLIEIDVARAAHALVIAAPPAPVVSDRAVHRQRLQHVIDWCVGAILRRQSREPVRAAPPASPAAD